jgi:transcription termination/antitermination protein NusG
MEKYWFVYYTRSRQEKKIDTLLKQRGFESFLPMQKVMRQWSDRKKKVEMPLFNSYLFVRTTIDQIPAILQTPGIAWNIRHNNQPAVLREEELRVIQRFIESGLLLEAATDTNFATGDHVKVVDGPLRGMQGTLVRTPEGEKFSIVLESIQQNIMVTVSPSMVAKI